MRKILSMFLAAWLLMAVGSANGQPSTPTYLQLIDRLDRANDGYCLDVLGSGSNIQINMPLTAHNCKGPEPYADEWVQYRADGTLYFPAYDRCVTVMGVNEIALPGTALMLKNCGKNEPFLYATNFQKFTFNDKNQVQLLGSDLCLRVSHTSHRTFSPKHKWRSLFVTECGEVSQSLSAWQIVPAGYLKK